MAETIFFRCKGCYQNFTYNSAYINTKIKCPFCKEERIVPPVSEPEITAEKQADDVNEKGLTSAQVREMIRAINTESFDDEELVSRTRWKLICWVRGKNFNKINEAAWESLCRRRGYILYRRNPRGF